MNNVKLNTSVMEEMKEELRKRRYEYAEDMLSLAQENAPQGVTGNLAGHTMHTASDKEDEIGFYESYAPFIEFGTDPFNAKLITITLPDGVKKKLGKQLRTDDSGSVLVPVWWDWAEKKVGISNLKDRYTFCWYVWKKIAGQVPGKEGGITAQHFFQRAIQEFKKQSVINKYFGEDVEVSIR